MLLLEYEGKALLREYGIPTPKGVVVRAGEAPSIDMPRPLMIKAQVLSGARGKGGGIRSVDAAADLRHALGALFATPVNNFRVEEILVEEKASFLHERYLGILVDGHEILLVLGRKGGIEVEQIATEGGDDFQTVRIDPTYGLNDYQVRSALDALGIEARHWGGYVDVAKKLAKLFFSSDAIMAEINPLVQREDGSLLALDARIAIDDGALYRQPRLAEIARRRVADDEIQNRMSELEIQYVPMGGSVGLLSSGAGVGVTVMDWVAREGQSLASFVDIDYAIMAGKTEEAIRLVLELLEKDSKVASLLINFTSCGLRLDLIAETLVSVLKERQMPGKAMTLHLAGNRAEDAHRILKSAGFPVVEKLGDAVRKVVRDAAGVAA